MSTLLTPHLDFGDALDKWRGLAWYAHKHSDVIRRAVAVTRIDGTDWGLDVASDAVRNALNSGEESLEALFKGMGHKRKSG